MSEYVIDEILGQTTLDQRFSEYTHNTEFLKSDLGQWHLLAFFSQKMVFKTNN